jgi:hypothetical protein
MFASTVEAEFLANATMDHSISHRELESVFKLQTRYVSAYPGHVVTVVLPPVDSISFKRLASEELYLSPVYYADTLTSQISSGSFPPIRVDTESQIIIKLINTPYSIGYYNEILVINTKFGLRKLRIY